MLIQHDFYYRSKFVILHSALQNWKSFFFGMIGKLFFVTLLRLSTSSVQRAWKGKNTVVKEELKTLSLMIIIILDYYFVMIIGMLTLLSSYWIFNEKFYFIGRQKVYDDDDNNKYECKHRKKWVIIKNWETSFFKILWSHHHWARVHLKGAQSSCFECGTACPIFNWLKKNCVA